MTAALLVSCGEPAPDNGRIVVKSKLEQPDAAALLRGLGMSTPPMTVELYEYLPGRDDTARLIMVMSEADWAAMRNAPPLSAIPPDLPDHMQSVLLSSDEGNWRPSADPGIKVAQTRLPNAEFITIGYSPAGSGRVRVYLLWGRT